MNFSKLNVLLLMILCVFVFMGNTSLHAQDADIAEIAAEAAPNQSELSPAFRMIERSRGFAVILLLIALVVSALYAALTGNTKAGIFVAIGAIILFGGFWILTIIIDSFDGKTTPTSEFIEDVANVDLREFDSELQSASSRSGISRIIAQFVGAGINILTTFIAPIIIIYGIILSISIAMGESNPETFRNYVLGFVFALMAMIIAQLFRAPLA